MLVVICANWLFRSAYSRKSKLGHLMQDAMVLPIFDGGNVGVRRRQIEKMFAMDDYDMLETAFFRAEKPNGINGHATNGVSS